MSRIAALVLAAGQSRRMAPWNKLLAVGSDGRCVVRRVVDAVSATRADSVTVVVGHAAEAVRGALAGTRAEIVACADYADGMSASLQAGLRAVSDAAAIAVCLGDLPLLTAPLVDTVLAVWRPGQVVVPECEGVPGSPVVWDRSFVPAMMALRGDTGARGLLRGAGDRVVRLRLDDPAIVRDADTPAALRVMPGAPWLAADGRAIERDADAGWGCGGR